MTIVWSTALRYGKRRRTCTIQHPQARNIRLIYQQFNLVGISLAVLGTLPLIWNMLKSIWMYCRLWFSVRKDLRKYFKFIIDPAAGTVTVKAQRLRLSEPGLWIRNKLEDPSEQESRFTHFKNLLESLGRHREASACVEKPEVLSSEVAEKRTSFRKSSTGSSICRSDHHASWAIQTVHGGSIKWFSSHVLCPRWMSICPRWMSIATHCKFPFEALNVSRYEDDEMACRSFEEDQIVRFTADIDLRTQPPPLQMTWTHFVWLTLGFEIDPEDLMDIKDGKVLSWENRRWQLHTSRVQDGWSFRVLQRGTYGFSIRTALARGGMMLLEKDGSVFLHGRIRKDWRTRLFEEINSIGTLGRFPSNDWRRVGRWFCMSSAADRPSYSISAQSRPIDRWLSKQLSRVEKLCHCYFYDVEGGSVSDSATEGTSEPASPLDEQSSTSRDVGSESAADRDESPAEERTSATVSDSDPDGHGLRGDDSQSTHSVRSAARRTESLLAGPYSSN